MVKKLETRFSAVDKGFSGRLWGAGVVYSA